MGETVYQTTGRVEGGKLKTRNLKTMTEVFSHWKDTEVIITVEKAHATRSVHANALYWAGYVNPLAEYTGYTPKQMHAYLKKTFLPKQRIEIVDKKTGAVIDEKDLDQLTTTTLNKIEFGEYLNEIAEFAASLDVRVGSNREDAA